MVELWVNSHVQELSLEYVILSVVWCPYHDHLTYIANAINYEDEGVTPNMIFWEHYFPLHLIFYNLFDLSKVSKLNSMASVWYQILISNFLPKNRNIKSLDIDEKTFLLLLNTDFKINLPHIMFEHLKMTLISFNEGKSCFIPYGRVLSEIFIQQVIEKTMVEVTSQIWGDKLKIPEAMKVIDPFKVKVVSLDRSSSSSI